MIYWVFDINDNITLRFKSRNDHYVNIKKMFINSLIFLTRDYKIIIILKKLNKKINMNKN